MFLNLKICCYFYNKNVRCFVDEVSLIVFENNTTFVDAKLTAFELATRAKTAGSSPNKKQKKTPARCLLKWCR